MSFHASSTKEIERTGLQIKAIFPFAFNAQALRELRHQFVEGHGVPLRLFFFLILMKPVQQINDCFAIFSSCVLAPTEMFCGKSHKSNVDFAINV